MAKQKEAELKKPMGRQIAALKARAREALGESASLSDLADKANELARAEGFQPIFTPEKMEPKAEGEGGGQRRRRGGGDEAPKEPTLSDLMLVAALAKEEEGGVTALRQRIADIATIADKVGGLPSLVKCLDALERLTGDQD